MRAAKLLLFVLAVVTLATAASAQRRFACADYTQGKVFIVAADGSVEWEYPAPACDDLTVLPNGNLLFVTGNGAKEVTLDKKVVWEYTTSSEVYACQRLSNGNTFIGECSGGRLLEVGRDGKIVREVRLLPEGTDGGHLFMRNARKLSNGHYLVCHSGAQVVKEYDAAGKVVREIPAPGGPHSVQRLRNGNTVISVGDMTQDAGVFEVDPKGKVVWQVTSKDLPGIKLEFIAGFQRLPNGNTVMSNWLGHGHLGEQPHIVEVTRDKKVAWTFADHKTMQTVSFVVMLGTGPKGKGER